MPTVLRANTAVCCGLLLAGFAGVSDAAIFSNTVVIDLGLATISDDGSGGELLSAFGATDVPVSPFAPQVGDTLVTAISFLNGDRLKIIDGPNVISNILGQTGPDYFESLVFSFAGSGFHSTFTTSVSFVDLEGSLSTPTPGGSSTGLLAQALYPSFTDTYISFTGLTMTTVISTLPSPGVQSYDSFGLWAGRAGGFEIISAAAVPEPASLAIWGLGAVGLAFGAYRRKKLA